MSGPWEKYQPASAASDPGAPAASTAPGDGPWAKYQPASAGTLAQPAASDEDHSFIDGLGHQLGLALRGGVQSIIALPATLADALIVNPANAAMNAFDRATGSTTSFRFNPQAQQAGALMDRAGVAQPQNATERVVQDVMSATGSAAGSVAAGKVMAKAAGPLTRAVGSMLAEGPGLQATSAATGAAASGIAREEGASPGAQVAAGVIGSLAPGFAAPAAKAMVRGAVRGGEAGRQQVADNVAAFEAAGTAPTLGQATNGRFARAAESLLAKTPGGAGVIAKRAAQQADEMAGAVQNVADELAPGANATLAGEAIERGVKTFKDAFKEQQTRLYNALDDLIPKDALVPVDRTREALAALNADIPNAPALSKWFKNARIQGIEQALQSDVAGNQSSLFGQGGALLPYEAVKKLRTLVGNEISDSGLVSDVPRSKWNALYAALSDDLGNAAKQVGPDAEEAWKVANDFTRTHMQRLDELSGILKRDTPEKIFSAAVSGTQEGDTVVRRVMSALPAEERKVVAAATLRRLGQATAGQQNAAGDAFSSETFLTNLSKISEAARKTIFGTLDVPGLEDRLAQFARVAQSRREGGRVFANPSGTAGAVAQGSLGAALTTGALFGSPQTVGAALAGPAFMNGAARVMTAPGSAKFLAGATALPKGARAAAATAAGQAGEAMGKIMMNSRGEPFAGRGHAERAAKRVGGEVQPTHGGWTVVVPPAQAAQQGDITAPSGGPFRNQGAALRAQRAAGGGEIVRVDGGWVVRPPAAKEGENVGSDDAAGSGVDAAGGAGRVDGAGGEADRVPAGSDAGGHVDAAPAPPGAGGAPLGPVSSNAGEQPADLKFGVTPLAGGKVALHSDDPKSLQAALVKAGVPAKALSMKDGTVLVKRAGRARLEEMFAAARAGSVEQSTEEA